MILLLPTLALAADITGKADIVDGGTIEIAGQRILLDGIDAPKFGETCGAGGTPWRCGQEAAFALADAVGRTWVECDVRDAGTLKLAIAVCRVGGPKGRDLGAWMVTEGWARAQRGTAYVALETAAKAARKGLWRSR
ncbi:MAG: thermonuclease family protein [Alphaproteobacteria bacterium]|nr:thermonuclease family protein [Alphaproteobacteria bacterium]